MRLIKLMHAYLGVVGAIAFALRFVIPVAENQVAQLHASQSQRWELKIVSEIGIGANVLSAFLVIYVIVWFVRFVWARIAVASDPERDALWD
jgi:hypothetical protein